ncbi:unnamed protein product [Rangifer tarandus platyrhynchus]|uniref:Uncharacterized protein n=2 Tax=Rangifer tarandus platyrhynchus TaxID=3082113 RepID=A0ACB0FA41_RANTA|nr:unnamed protein product [Rangifer tarandus platyrhynchus]CAI9709642.1 unnamed protein product [Rangifer tarandus platyrhynchus]
MLVAEGRHFPSCVLRGASRAEGAADARLQLTLEQLQAPGPGPGLWNLSTIRDAALHPAGCSALGSRRGPRWASSHPDFPAPRWAHELDTPPGHQVKFGDETVSCKSYAYKE